MADQIFKIKLCHVPKKIISGKAKMYIAVSLAGIIFFLMIYGPYVLNPCYTDWLESNLSDQGQHYIGWKAYRNGRWMFPIGCTDLIFYPYKSSVIFTDSIPCFAVFFKLFRWMLPADFQYFGIWSLLSVVLQGILSAKIIKRMTGSCQTAVTGSMFFMCAPVLIKRMFGHSALTAHWIMLLAFDQTYELCEEYDSIHLKKIVACSGLTGMLAASTHIYFIPFNGILYAGGILLCWLRYRKIGKPLSAAASHVVFSALAVFLLGGFTTGSSAAATTEKGYTFNLLGFINPFGWSDLLKDLPVYQNEQLEGFAYLGAGTLFLLLYELTALVSQNGLLQKMKQHRNELITFAVVSFVTLFIAAGSTATIGPHILYSITLPVQIEKLWSVFRSSGRFSWIIFYSIYASAVWGAWKLGRSKRSVFAVLAAALVIQVLDLHSAFVRSGTAVNKKVEYTSSLETDAFWKYVMEDTKIRHIMLAPNARFFPMDKGAAVIHYALDNGLTVNSFYFSHDASFQKVSEEISKTIESEDDTALFIFPDEQRIMEYYPELCASNMNFYAKDGMMLGYFGNLSGLLETGTGGTVKDKGL